MQQLSTVEKLLKPVKIRHWFLWTLQKVCSRMSVLIDRQCRDLFQESITIIKHNICKLRNFEITTLLMFPSSVKQHKINGWGFRLNSNYCKLETNSQYDLRRTLIFINWLFLRVHDVAMGKKHCSGICRWIKFLCYAAKNVKKLLIWCF